MIDPGDRSTIPNLDDVPRPLRFMMRLSVLLVGALSGVMSFGLLLLALGGLHKLGLDGAIANMLMMVLSPLVFVSAIAASMSMERLQERRLRAVMIPSARKATTLSGTKTSVAVSAHTIAPIDVVDTKL